MRRVIGTGMGLMMLASGPALAQTAAPSTPAPSTPAPAQPAAAADTAPIVINGKAPVVVHKIDRTVYDIHDTPQATTGSVSDVLGTLPSVTVDPNGNVSVRGASVQVVVDGKPSPALRGANLAQALQSMPANTVARIEVVTNPGPEFRTNAATVINIVTRKTGVQAPTGDLVVNAGDQGRYNSTLSGSFGAGKWAFNGSVSLRQDRRKNVAAVDRITRNDDGAIASHMIENTGTSFKGNVATLDLGTTYTLSDNDSFSLAGNASVRARRAPSGDHIIFRDPISDAIVEDSNTVSTGPQHYNSRSLTGGYKHKGPHDGETFSLQVRHEQDDFLQNRYFSQTYRVPVVPVNAYHQLIRSRELTDDINGDYVLPLAQDTQFKTGFDVESTRNDQYNFNSTFDNTTGAETPKVAGGTRFLIDQTLSAGYVDYQQPIGKWIAEAGLRAENMTTRIRYGRTEPVTETSDLEWSPSLFVSRPLGDRSKVKLTYSHRIDRPSSDQLYGLEQQLDAQDIYTGNPNLRPAQTESFEAGYDFTSKKLSFSGTAYARQTRDAIVEYSFYRNPGDTVLISTVENAGKGETDGIDMSLDWHPSDKVGLSVTSNIFHITQTAPVAGADVRHSLDSASTKVTLTYNPTKADMLQIQGLSFGSQLLADGVSTNQPFYNLSYSHKLTPKLKLVVTDNDAFRTSRWRQRIETAQYRDHTSFTLPGRMIYVGLDYKLGAAKGN